MKYAIVFQGLLSDSSVHMLNNIRKLDAELHVITWQGVNDLHLCLKKDFSVHLLEDIGSFEAYRIGDISKQFNLDRLFYSLDYIEKHLNSEVIIKCRTDVVADFEKIYWLYKSSNKFWGSVGVNTSCPRRLTADPLLWVVSDWIFIYRRKSVDFSVWKVIRKYMVNSDFSVKFGDYSWHLPLGAEQVLSMVMTGNIEHIYDKKIRAKLKYYEKDDWNLHYDIQSKTLNIPVDSVDLSRSSKYRGGYSIRWLLHTDANFKDDGSFTIKIHFLVLRLLIKTKNRIGKIVRL